MIASVRREMVVALDFLTFAVIQERADGLLLTDMYPPEIGEVADLARQRGWHFEPIGPARYRLRFKIDELV